MPFVDIFGKNDFASIFYETNSLFSNISGIDPEKPTVLILHPLFLDTTWLDHHWGDPRLYKSYNLVAFDMRCSGKSICRPNERHDSWVEAADLALCHQKLRLPPCHILALEPISTSCALRFAVLFPEMCLSLALCNVPSPSEPKSMPTVLDEATQRWCFAPDTESFEHAGAEAVSMLVSPECEADLVDELIAYWATKTARGQRLRVAEPIGVYLNRANERLQRTPLEPHVLASIKQPVLIIHGDRNELHSQQHAEDLKEQLTGVEGGAILFTVVGGSSNLSLMSHSASALNRVYTRFLSERVAPAKSDTRPPTIPTEERMHQALTQLSEIMNQPEMASRDPLSPISFSCLSEEAIDRQAALLKAYATRKESSFSPLDTEGRPLRKLSGRY